jgi:hypothetical protein
VQLISKSVGDGGVNNKSDVALVQAILVKTQRFTFRPPLIAPVASGPYLASYDGICGNATVAAIRDFQADHFPKAPASTLPAGVTSWIQTMLSPKPGLVEPNDVTWQKLVEKAPPDFSDLRVLDGGKTVYLAQGANRLHDQLADAGAFTFRPEFTKKVVACITAMHRLTGIALGVCDAGARRTFQKQMNLLGGGGGVTSAGPGESFHNWGFAVDLGFDGLRWLRPNGDVVTDDSWLHALSPGEIPNAAAMVFWEELRDVGTGADVGLFQGPEADRPHLQNWDDSDVDLGASLADLLSRSGSMKWSSNWVPTKPHYRYKSDLGLGGEKVELGSATQIWNSQALLTLETLKAAKDAVAPKPKPGASPPPPVTEADVTAMKQKLREQFDLADANWQNWVKK